MSNKFLQMIESAQESKRKFDLSLDSLKESLEDSVSKSDIHPVKYETKKIETTGWLKGSLSYPWAVVCIIPAILEMVV